MKEGYQCCLTFKNVGQGDCIFVEWRNSKGAMEVGIIDCNLGRTVDPKPIFKRLAKYEYLSFLVMSHPHTDHYSGMGTLLDHCSEEKIPIRQIIHTAQYGMPNLLSMADSPRKTMLHTFVNTTLAKKQLYRVLKQFHKLAETGSTPTDVFPVNSPQKMEVDAPEIDFWFLSPNHVHEHADYVRSLASVQDGEPVLFANNPNANLLSTVILISAENWNVLLTSDVRKKSLKRILERHKEKLLHDERPLIIAQVPHHGSANEETHYPEFWKALLDENQTSVVISAGESIHEHPREEVVRFFAEHAKTVYATNNVHGYRAYYDDQYRQQEEELMRSLEWVEGAQRRLYNSEVECGEQEISIRPNGTYEVVTN